MRHRGWSVLAASAAFVLFPVFDSSAQEYPNRPIRFLVGNAPGGGTDTVARLIAPKMSEGLGKSVVVDNRAGGTGAVASGLVAKGSPDGYSILIITRSSHSISPALQSDLPYDPVKDFAAISLLVTSPNVLVAHPSVSANTVKELVALVKSKPGTFNYGSTGTGSVSHMAAELLQSITGIKMTHIPYKGAGPALTDLLGGRLQLMFSGPASIIPHVNSKRLKALAVGGAKRTPGLEDVPTFAEAGFPGVEASQWYGLVTTAGVPKAVIDRLNREVVRVLQLPDVKERLTDNGFDPESSTSQAFGQLLKEDVVRWQKVVKASGIKLE